MRKIFTNGFLAETEPAKVRNCDVILHAVVKMGTWVIVGGLAE